MANERPTRGDPRPLRAGMGSRADVVVGRRSFSFDASPATLDDFHSADPVMEKCLDLARLAARTDLPILIVGESGTGKTLLARAIHNSSKRASGPFVSFNGAALSDTLLDSQLFGHEKGAFTGADRGIRGKFELAHAGTLFIDEIGDMSPTAQAKILRAVEYGEFEKLGSETVRHADVRVISATHWPLPTFVDAQHFRKDLFYRISGITLSLPPLRERPNDLGSLIAAEIRLASRKEGKRVTGLDRRAADLLLSYAWPGNLRELSRVVHTAVALSPGEIIPADTILLSPVAVQASETSGGRGSDAAGGRGPEPVMESESDLTLRTAELRHVRRVLAVMGGNKRRAARALGISRQTLDRKLASARPPRKGMVSD